MVGLRAELISWGAFPPRREAPVYLSSRLVGSWRYSRPGGGGGAAATRGKRKGPLGDLVVRFRGRCSGTIPHCTSS